MRRRQGLDCEGEEAAVILPPVGGRLVVFDSRIEHEVLPAHMRRWPSGPMG